VRKESGHRVIARSGDRAVRTPPRLEVPALGPTDRLVGLPAIHLSNALDGSPPRLPTAVRVAARGGALLIRFDGRDRGVVATLTRRDDPLWKEDVFEVFLSAEDPPRTYYEFEVNPLGALFDARVESPEGRRETMRVDVGWDCPGFSARVRRREDLWSALLTIPLAPLEPCGARLWRANFYRIDRGESDEYSAWSPTGAEPPDFHRPERFGFLGLPE
jgi:Carbohydrate-binding family 9